MRPVPTALMSSLHSLHKRPPIDSPSDWAWEIENVATENHPIVVLSLAPLAFHSHPMIANTAVRVLHRVLQRLDENGILWISREARHFGSAYGNSFSAWAELRQPDVAKLNIFGDASASLMCLCSVHANGYVRQAAVERLANYRGALSMAFLLLRINDWVRPVRAFARLSIFGRLHEARQGDRGRFDELLENLALAQRIERWSRDDHGPVRDAIRATLAKYPVDDLLERAHETKIGARQLRIFRLMFEHHPEARFKIIQHGLNSRNGAVRFWTAREAVRSLSLEELNSFINAMQNDPLAIVRYEAVFALATKLRPNDNAILIPFLVDTSPDVRFLSAYYLDKNKFDVRGYYLRLVAEVTDSTLAAVIAAIGSRGKPGDETQIIRYCEHPSPEVRAAAVFTRGKLQRDREVDWILKALHDPHKSVVREAARQLDARVHIVSPHHLQEWLNWETRLSMRKLSLRIGAKLERWDALIFLLRAAARNDTQLYGDIERELERWLQRFIDWYNVPSSAQIRQLEEALPHARRTLKDSTLDGVADVVRRQKKR